MTATRTSIATPLVLAALACLSLSCHSLFYEREEGFCCESETACRAGGAPGGRAVACTKPGEVCDIENSRCIPDPTIIDCHSPADCTAADPQRPACVDGQCYACGDAEPRCPTTAPVCAPTNACSACLDESSCARFPATPHCSGSASGACVECRPGTDADCGQGTAPICDGTASTCRACRRGECSTTCDTERGSCVAEDAIAFVTMTGSDAGTCTRAQPCRSIQRAINVAGARSWILVGAGTYDAFTITGKALMIVAAQGAEVSRTAIGPVVEITGAAKVTIEGLRIHKGLGDSGDGLRCSESGSDKPSLTLRRVAVERNTGIGIKATGCTVVIEQSIVSGNTNGGVSVSGGAATIVNSLIAPNGGINSTIGNVKLDSVTALTFQFNTLGGGVTKSDAFAAGIQCSASDPVTLADNIIHGVSANQVAIPAPNCSFAFNLSNQILGGTNVSTTQPSSALFVDPDMADYHSKATSPAIAAADPAATVDVDGDGDPRPLPAGTRRDIGADEVSQ